MPTKTVIGVVIAIVLVAAIAIAFSLFLPHKPEPAEHVEKKGMQKIEVGERIKLPESIYKSNVSVEEALSKRRSIRTYSGENLTIEEVSQLYSGLLKVSPRLEEEEQHLPQVHSIRWSYTRLWAT